jgi:hypothetical protein
MSNSRTNARVTGILFILGTATGMAAAALSGPILQTADLLAAAAAHRGQLLLSALFVMFMGLSCAGIGMSLYPVIKRRGEGLAAGVLGFRVIEGAFQIASAVGFVALLALGEGFVKAGSPASSFFLPAAAVVMTVTDFLGNGAYLFPWSAAAFIYYGVFYRTRLLPRWLSLWGFAGLGLMLAAAFAGIFGLLGSMTAVQILLNLPIMLQELVLAVWLIVRGYRD